MFGKLCFLVLSLVLIGFYSQVEGATRFERQVNFGDLFTQRTSTRRPLVTPPLEDDSSTTTTASPRYTACMNACQTTPQYNPVCGSDRVTYSNRGRLNCANQCGKNIEVLFSGTCQAL